MLISCDIATHEKGTKIEREANFPHWTCGYVYEGEFELNANGNKHIIAAPIFLLISPNQPYDFTVTIPDTHIWAIFDSTVRISNSLKLFENQVTSKTLDDNDDTHQRLIQGMKDVYYWWRSEPMQAPLAENALERSLLLYAMAHHTIQKMDPRISKVTEWIADKTEQQISVPEMASIVHLSPSRFAALFQKETGITPAKYVEAKKLERAGNLLLSTNQTISEISESVGYRNAFHFSTRFKDLYGQSPREYRRKPLKQRFVIIPELPNP